MMKFFRRKLPALALALVMAAGMVPAVSAASADITLKVTAGKRVSFDREDFYEYFEDYYEGGEFQYVTFSPDNSYKSSVGYVYYNYGENDEESFSKSDLESYHFYYTRSRYGDYPLNYLSFAADEGAASQTLTFDFRVYGEDEDGDDVSRTGILDIEITGKKTGSTGADGDTITYQVESDDEVEFDAEDFQDVFQDRYNYDLRYVVFDKPASSTFSDGTLYYRHGKSTEVAFSRSNLNDYRFYYSDSTYGDYNLGDLTFVSDKDFEDEVKLPFTAYGSGSREVTGVVVLTPEDDKAGSYQDEKGDIEYEVDPNDHVTLDEDDFDDYYDDEGSGGSLKYVKFTKVSNLKSATGTMYCWYDNKKEVKFTASALKDYAFYYGSNEDLGDYPLSELTFAADRDFDDAVVLEFRAYSTSSKYVNGVLVLRSSSASGVSKGEIVYEASSTTRAVMQESDFKKFYDEKGNGGAFRYITFTNGSKLKNPNGLFFVTQGLAEQILSWDQLDGCKFYYSAEAPSSYASNEFSLSALSFAGGRNYTQAVSIQFRAWASSSRYVDGTVTFKPGTGTTTPSPAASGADIMYSTTSGAKLQLNPNDFARFLNKTYATSTLQYVKLGGVASKGALYYNYYNASAYGARQTQLNAAAVSALAFYYSPTSTGQYSLGELTFDPGTQTNYCEFLPFTAYAVDGRSVSGTVLISVTINTVSDVYGPVPRNTTSVPLPPVAVYNAVQGGTGQVLGSIRLLKIPASSVGVVYLGTGYTPANTTTAYTYAAGNQSIGQLRFVPATGYTGSVELPYLAYNANGTPIAAGKICLGVMNAVKKYTDVPTAHWCYKYVTELSDAAVVNGYEDGTYKPDNTVSYGEALKLAMLAAGYSQQAATDNTHWASGYLAKAQADGLVSGSVTLNKPITRLEMAQLCAKAMKLSVANLSSQKPFTDTTDPYVQALNAAGVVEGFFNNGTYTFHPGDPLTRGQAATIVWRMMRQK